MSMNNPVHPGEILRDLIIEPLKLTTVDVAAHLCVSRKTLSKIFNGTGASTHAMSLRLEIAFGIDSYGICFCDFTGVTRSAIYFK